MYKEKKLDVVMPVKKQSPFLVEELLDFVGRARPDGKKKVILFPEGALYSYGKYCSKGESEQLAASVKGRLSQDVIAIFCVMCKEGGAISDAETRIYAVDSSNVASQPKRLSALYVYWAYGFSFSQNRLAEDQRIWRERWQHQTNSSFITLDMGGMKIDVRACVDVMCSSNGLTGNISLVSAAGLDKDEMGWRIKGPLTEAIIVADSEGSLYVPGRCHTLRHHEVAPSKPLPRRVRNKISANVSATLV